MVIESRSPRRSPAAARRRASEHRFDKWLFEDVRAGRTEEEAVSARRRISRSSCSRQRRTGCAGGRAGRCGGSRRPEARAIGARLEIVGRTAPRSRSSRPEPKASASTPRRRRRRRQVRAPENSTPGAGRCHRGMPTSRRPKRIEAARGRQPRTSRGQARHRPPRRRLTSSSRARDQAKAEEEKVEVKLDASGACAQGRGRAAQAPGGRGRHPQGGRRPQEAREGSAKAGHRTRRRRSPPRPRSRARRGSSAPVGGSVGAVARGDRMPQKPPPRLPRR